MRIRLINALFVLSGFFCLAQQAQADYVHPEGEAEIAPGIFARNSAIVVIQKFDVLEHVVKLYESLVPSSEKGQGAAVAKDDQLAVFVNTLDGVPGLITQIYVRDLTHKK